MLLLLLWLLSDVLWISEGRQPSCNDERNVCYQLHQSSATHSIADSVCRSDYGGTLATIMDSKTQGYISNLVRNKGQYWIGGKLDVMNQWTWVDGSTNKLTGQYAMRHYSTANMLASVALASL